MLLSQQIQQDVEKLPVSVQAEVLDFVQYLVSKTARETTDVEDKDWTALSLASAMRHMEDEGSPDYSTADLRVAFS